MLMTSSATQSGSISERAGEDDEKPSRADGITAEVGREMKEWNEKKEAVMSSVVSAMVGRERTLRRPRRHHATTIAAIGDPAFVAWHKTRIMWLRRLLKGLRKRRLSAARKYLAYIQKRYPEESKQLGLENVTVKGGEAAC